MKYLYWLISGLCLIPMPAFGQVAADDSLSTKVTTSDRRNFTVEAGYRAGNNLFHSFESFSVPTNGSVMLSGEVGWQDWRIPTLVKTTAKSLDLTRDRAKTNIVEARNWKINQRGQIVLTAEINGGFDGNEFWSKYPQCIEATSSPGLLVSKGESS